MRRAPLALAAAAALGGLLATTSAAAPHAGPPQHKKETPPHRDEVPADRYAMAGDCYVARSAASGRYVARAGSGFAATGDATGAERLHFQAYDLGKYLLFASHSDFVAADSTLPVAVNGSRAVVAAAAPSGAAEWVVRQAGNAYVFQSPVDDGQPESPGPLDPPIAGTLTSDAAGTLAVTDGATSGTPARFTLELSTGCAAWPEVTTNVEGDPATGATPYAETQGYLDAHLHGMAFEFLGGKAHCGRPWHPYGVAAALVDCPDHEPGGYGAVLEQVLSGSPGGHDTRGWPDFPYWPKHDSLTHEQTYYKWLERAWRGGLRMYTNLLVENGVLCQLYPYKKNSCNEMDSVHLQAQRLREFERYVDAQNGGPGRGWLRVVTDPFQARRVINAGKLAVIMGIEVSVPFDCVEFLGLPQCTAADIARSLDDVYALGVRQMELTNKFDNALTGVTGDSGSTGVIVNNGNKYQTGHYWKMATCADPANGRTDKTQLNLQDNTPSSPLDAGRDAIFGAVLSLSGPTGAAPAYPKGPHCNTIGLSDLGKDAVHGLMARGMVFDPDHMSAAARKAALDYIGTLHYSGVVSSHSWADDPTYHAVLDAGGVVTPHATGASEFVGEWRKLRAWADPRFTFGLGYGSDVNGFSAQPPPHGGNVQYPFTGLGGVTVDRQVSGNRTYDVNTDGVDHYGLYPDWIEDLRLVAGADGDALMADMRRGPEAYLQMWERAVGIAPDACRDDVLDLTADDLATVRRGMTPEQVLHAIGQPHARVADTFTYCTGSGTATVTFGSTGRVASVA